VLSIVGGWFWKPAVFFGENKFERVLAPVFESHETAKPYSLEQSARQAPAGTVSRKGEAQPSPAEANAPEQSHEAQPAAHGKASSPQASETTEHLLMAASVAAGILGFLLAWFLYYLHPDRPARIAEAMGGVYRTVLNKYDVDEGYYATLVNPIVNGSRDFLWRTVDVGVVDGAVNGAGTSARAASNSVRRLQSGNIRSYAGWVAIGACVVLGYMIWTGVGR
jgi:NADH-quinone oxidoreductase subunit L